MNKKLEDKTEEELKEIMRDSIDNKYVPSSIYHKAKQELEFRHTLNRKNKNDEILKLSPEFYGVGINLKSLWRKIKLFFQPNP